MVPAAFLASVCTSNLPAAEGSQEDDDPDQQEREQEQADHRAMRDVAREDPDLEGERAAYSVLDEVPLDLHMVMLLVRGMPLDRDAAALIARTVNGERLELHPSAIESSALGSDEGLFLLWSDLPEGIFRYSLDFASLVPGQEPTSVHLLSVW